MTRVLIATHPRDVHAAVVAIGLRRKGHEAVLWYGADFPTKQSGAIEIDNDGHGWSMTGEQLEHRSTPFDVVWLRRPGSPALPPELDPGDLLVARRACTLFYRAFWHLVAPDAFWVNPLSSRNADIKPLQLIEAARVGFTIPPTLCGNDPERIRAFLTEHRGQAVYKPFAQAHWESEHGIASLFTSPVDLEDLPEDELLRLSAGIFQRAVPKKHELRVTVIGEQLFAVKLHSQQIESARQDWRRALGALEFEATELPPEIAHKCIALMKRLGLVFGCFDLIVTPSDEIVFLEVNPMGQFLWVEGRVPSLRLTDAFCELLIGGRPRLQWSPSSDGLELARLRTEAQQLVAEAQRRHVEPTVSHRVQEEGPPPSDR